MITKVKQVTSESIVFENNWQLYSEHEQSCCENHYLDFSELTLKDFEDLEFDLKDEKFFNRIPDYGIELIPILGHSVKIPGYGSNNGYYSSNLTLVLDTTDGMREYDVTECQEWNTY